MPPGDERTEAMQKALVLRNASEIQLLFGGKRDRRMTKAWSVGSKLWCYC